MVKYNMEKDSQIIQEVSEIYTWIDGQLAGIDRSCKACGQCCDFEAFGHRLYVTTPELMFFKQFVGGEIREMTAGVCPYRIDGKCSVYLYRFSGCRIFACEGDSEEENLLSEQTVHKFKTLCVRHGIPYHYVYLKSALDLLRQGDIR